MIEALELTNFRSYERARVDLHPEVTLVVGPNASGKTNLLESLYVLATTKSFRVGDRELIRDGADFFRVVAREGETEYALGVSAADGLTKKVTHDGLKKTLSAHVGQIQVTLFEPMELALVSGPPEGRRRYLDFGLCQTDKVYFRTLRDYKRVLRQRNSLLDLEDKRLVRDQIFAWDVKLAELAVEIYERRRELVGALNEVIPLLYRDIAGSDEGLVLEYLPSVAGEYREQFLTALERNLARDMAAGFTTIGPHREDFKVRFKNNDIMSVASRGEVRTVVLALKMAELTYTEKKTGVRPILLLDDVFSELDAERRGYLLGRLSGYQTIVTTTDADAVTREFATPHSVISTLELSHA